MELADYLRILRKYWRSVAAVTLATLLLAALFSLVSKPAYTSNSTIFLSIRNASTAGELNAGSSYVENQAQSFAKVAKTPIVLQPVIDQLGLDTTPEKLAGSITATIPTNTATIDLSVVRGDPTEAAAIASAVSDRLIVVVAQLSPPGPDGAEPVVATVVKPATTPTSPTSPKVAQNLALGVLLGLLLGAGQAILRDTMNVHVRTVKDIERVTDRPVLGTIAFDSDAAIHPLVLQVDPHSPRAEAYRRLRTNLQFLGLDEGKRSIVITSSISGEGKTTSAINIASTLATAGERVLVIDADLRRPKVANYLQLEGSVGLTTVLIGKARLEDVVQPYGSTRMDVLTAGPVPPNPAELLGFNGMRQLIDHAMASYDSVIIDAPPLLPVTDAAVLSDLASGTLLIAGARVVRRPELAAAIASLEQVDARILGVVLNKAQPADSGRYGYRYSYDYYGARDGKTSAPTEALPTFAAPPRHDPAPPAAAPARAIGPVA